MREIRLSGLEGGETQSNASSLPLSIARTTGRSPAPRLRGQRAGDPHQCAFEGVETEGCKSLHGFDLDPLTESNCVPAKGGGEQLKVNF